MKKKDIYIVRSIFEKILNDYRNDRPQNKQLCRATLIEKAVSEGVDLCNSYLNKMKP